MNIDELPGWFAPENRMMLDQLIRNSESVSGIEIGCFLGLSTVWFCYHLHRLQCVDTWRENSEEPGENNLVLTLKRMGTPRDFYHVWEHNVCEALMWSKVTPIRGRSDEVHPLVVDADLVYIDGDHSYEGCKRDIELYLPKARKIICGDDYVKRSEFGVIQAVKDMLPGAQSYGPFWYFVKE